MKIRSLFLLLAVFALILGGCKDEENPAGPAGPTLTSYVGVMAGTGVSGTLSVVIPTAKRAFNPSAEEGDTVEVTATLKINGGATIPLTGHYIVATGAIHLTGGGYTFDGIVTPDGITGTFTYPGGGGIFTCEEGTAANTQSYCGRYQDNTPGTEAGYFNLTINGSAIYVLVYPDDGGGSAFATTGSLSAENVISIYNPENTAIVVATGVLNPTAHTVSGQYFGDPGGTWSGALCN